MYYLLPAILDCTLKQQCEISVLLNKIYFCYNSDIKLYSILVFGEDLFLHFDGPNKFYSSVIETQYDLRKICKENRLYYLKPVMIGT